ncbi:Ribonuclease H domain [Dillenia turbinata]|uniref:Ribonuclease H domain n=1 Tax=Dillenia turbinata TaxID=194707 RepID=A0AAN8VM96_9MAGN
MGWRKLNFDGSSKARLGKASIGGVFRDHNAEFLLGYAESIGRTSSTVAELIALREGNEAADKFAQMGHRLKTPRVWHHVCPDEVLPFVLDDAEGKIILRKR